MRNLPSTVLLTTVQRHYLRVMAFAVIVCAVGMYWYSTMHQKQVIIPKADESTTTAPVSRYARSAPVRIRIPSINLDTTFVPPLRLNPDKTVSVPDNYTQVGWYEGGATPGEIGPAVILGHVDSYKGPAVFFSLGQVHQGDEVIITRADGTDATFVIESFKRYSQDDFPTAEVYGSIPYAGLRLVTCTGVYDRTKQKYTQNLVVYARLKTGE